uniref:integumentary mucin B.1-like n=1 Tax=Pristiophorus japonicus TaxID=55135 RepID=UPI00398EBBE8
MNSVELDCTSLEAAAMLCNGAGSCVDWRNSTNGVCDYTCPRGFIYQACSRYNHNSCKHNMMIHGERFSEPVEGCFCPTGMMLSEDGSQCVTSCARCKDYSGRLRHEGEKWSHHKNRCMHYRCVDGVVAETKISCSSRQSCAESERKWDEYHCCYTCPLPVQDCKVKPKLLNITKDGCSANVQVKSCEGKCSSFSIFDPHINDMKHDCQCCQENESEIKIVNLRCKNGRTKQYMYISVKSCKCKICADSQNTASSDGSGSGGVSNVSV